jgi:hypothetical protein
MAGPIGQRNERSWDNKRKLQVAREIQMLTPVTKETRAKMSKAAKGRVNKASLDPRARAKAAKTMSKGVIAYTYPDREFIGQYSNNIEAGEALNIHKAIVATVARGVYKQCRGYTCEYVKK